MMLLFLQRKKLLIMGLIAFALLILFPSLFLLWIGKTQVAIILLLLPVVLGVLTHPSLALYLFLVSVSYYHPIHFNWLAIHPFDIAGLLLIGSVGVDFVVRRRTFVASTFLDSAYLYLIGATFLSGFLAFDKSLSVVPSLRIVLVYLIFRSVYVLALDIGWRKLCYFFIGHVFVLSAINLVLFVVSAGAERAFGPAWLAYETYSMTACPMALLFLLLSRTRAERWLWIVVTLTILLGIFSTLSRGPLLTVVLAMPAVFYVSNRIRRKSSEYAKTGSSLGLVTLAGLVAVVVLMLATTLLTTFVDRINELVASINEPQGSIALRIILWKAAFVAFLDHPITGVGIGNFKLISSFVPSLRLNEHWARISSMSAHNVILQYLSETGLVGASALLLLAWRGTKGAFGAMTRFTNMDIEKSKSAGALVIAMVVFSMTIFYMRAWSWGQGGHIMAILFALVAASITDAKSVPKELHPKD